MRALHALGIVLLALAAAWFVSDNIYPFEAGAGGESLTLSEGLVHDMDLLYGRSPEGAVVGGLQLSVIRLVGAAGVAGTIILALVGAVCFLPGLRRKQG